jgi:tubulin--tyrosine ligase
LKKVSGSGNNNSLTSSANKHNLIKKGIEVKEEDNKASLSSHNMITYNHMENNFHLSNKKALYYNMKIYYESIG